MNAPLQTSPRPTESSAPPPMSLPLSLQPSFHGEGGALFGIYFVGGLLSAITLGIYSFWARVNVRHYLYGHTELAGDRFQYHGTGRELLIGTLKAIALFVGLIAVAGGIGYLTHPVVGQALIYIALALLTPVVTIGALRYRMSRTSWRGIRFSFRGRIADYAKVFVPGWGLTMLTLGLYGPWFFMRTREYRFRHIYFGNRALSFDGQGLESTLLVKSIVAALLMPFTLGLSILWHMAWMQRELWSRTSFQSATFRSTITGGALFKHVLVNMLLMVCTFGIGFAWIKARNMRFAASHLHLEGNLDLDRIVQEAQDASATGDELGEMLDLGLFDLELGI